MILKFACLDGLKIHGYNVPLNLWSHVILSVDERHDLEPLRGVPRQRYCEMRLNGQSHNMAMVLASRQFPGIKTDAIFNQGKFAGSTDDRTGRIHQRTLIKLAEEAGVSTTGKWYCSGLAAYPGDPVAWIDSQADALRIAEDRGLKLSGYIDYEPPEQEPLPSFDVDPALLHREAAEVCSAAPGSDYREVYEQLHDLRSGKTVFTKPHTPQPLPEEVDG